MIPIPNVNGRTLEYVIQSMKHHHTNKPEEIEKPLYGEQDSTKGKIEEVVSTWDRTFLNTDLVKNGNEKKYELLVDLIMATNFLNIKKILNLRCAKMASMIQGKHPNKNKSDNSSTSMCGVPPTKQFYIQKEEKIREDNSWCEEA